MKARAHGKLSEEAIKALRAPEKGNKVYPFGGDMLQGVTAPMGYGVKVTKAGHRSHVLDYRVAGIERQFTIGDWPTWPAIRAIRFARELRQKIDKGADPQAEKQAALAPAPSGRTVGDVLDEHVTRYLKKEGRRTADHVARTFERLVKPRIGHVGIYELRRSHVVEMLDEIEDEHGPVMADRVLAYVRKAFNWYAARDDQFNTPIVRGMARTKPRERARKRILADDEIRDLWAALDKTTDPDWPACYPRFIRSLLLTVQRRDEVAKMQWPEIDSETWIIPPERYKTGLEHAVPLTLAGRAVIGSKPEPRKDSKGRPIPCGPFVFSTTDGGRPFSGYSKAKKALDEKIAELRAKEGRKPMAPWVLHDLRRTGRSLMSRAGVDGDIAERVLGHVIPGVRGVYDRYAYFDEKRDALDKLAAMVERILKPPAGNVTHLERRRAPVGA